MRSSNNPAVHAVIVGAGPYGLSLAAHLREARLPFRIFGRPMQTWQTQMPVGMKLKSDGFASNLSAGRVPFTLEDFCRITGRAYHPTDIPVDLADFIAYGQEFARRFVPALEPQDVVRIEQQRDSGRRAPLFLITTASGETFTARHVIVATGVSLFQYVPPVLAVLAPGFVTHSTDHTDFSAFTGRDVTVIGRGASSLNAAALLHETGAHVTLLSRRERLVIHSRSAGGARSLWQRLRHPSSPLGYSLRSWIASTAPQLLHALPTGLRHAMMYKHLGPAGGTALEGRITGLFPTLLGWEIDEAIVTADKRIRLRLRNATGNFHEHITEHVIAGTGFRTDIRRMHFLSPAITEQIALHRNAAPVLDARFQSSLHGLHMIGPVAGTSFGPLLRFAAGAHFAAETVTAHLAADLARITPKVERRSPVFATQLR